jgi:hypothetical protein
MTTTYIFNLGECKYYISEFKNDIIETTEKLIRCSFVGSQTHTIRNKLDILKELPAYLIQTKGRGVSVT